MLRAFGFSAPSVLTSLSARISSYTPAASSGNLRSLSTVSSASTRLNSLSPRALPNPSKVLLMAAAAFLTTTPVAAASTKEISLATWNVAAINNNPFEYWISYDADPRYDGLMKGVEKFMSPAKSADSTDLPVARVFTDAMYDELEARLRTDLGVEEELLAETRNLWKTNFSQRKIISGFLRDAELGSKRLVSMPDRITNTMRDVKTETTKYRPTPINCCGERFDSYDDWWKKWLTFMFVDGEKSKAPAKLLKKIPRSKYPTLTVEDERVSLPLQIVSLAIFDAILVHMLESMASGWWQDLRHDMCKALNLNKDKRIEEILLTQYIRGGRRVDVMFLQEVSSTCALKLKRTLGEEFSVHVSSTVGDQPREQMSVLALRKASSVFNVNAAKDVTEEVQQVLFSSGKKPPVEDGDLVAVLLPARLPGQRATLLASFHGDTDGLATLPVLAALHSYVSSNDYKLIFGLDANAYEFAKPGKQLDVREFVRIFRDEYAMTSCFGLEPRPDNYTTFNARTFLQPQLNKASSKEEIRKKGDVNPKDFILTLQRDGEFRDTQKDNTGEHKYVDGMVFPTPAFPSDHGILSSVLSWRVEQQEGAKSEL